MKRNFILTAVLGLAAMMLVVNVSQAQSYFYGYYYPDEHRFVTSKVNRDGVYDYSTVTPQWNALHDRDYGAPGRDSMVPTGRPLYGPNYYPSPILPSGSGGYDTSPRLYYGQPLSGPDYAPSRILPSGSGGYDTTPRLYYGQPLTPAPAVPPAPAVSPQASIRVLVPDPQAVVYFGDYQTRSTGTERVYQSPAMTPGTYNYQIKVAYKEAGQQLVQERTVTVTPGQSLVVDFRDATTATPAPATTTVSRNER